mmetsp:Transcript_4515/g.12091  ORF Transcript_4515/g.12091 Transcript_4515/m.12091 type:complete len:207 (-) Transcript_4515:35-655(-)
MDASAHSSARAAETEANRSGIDVPRATKVMAVIESSMPVTHPKSSAKSMTMQVTPPMQSSEVVKHAQPPSHPAGGTITAKRSFQGRPTMWKNQSAVLGCSSSSATLKTDSTTSSYHSPMLARIMSIVMWMRMLLRLSTESFSFSLRIVTVNTPVCEPAVLVGFSTAPPRTSSRTMTNWRLSSPIFFGSSLTTTVACVVPCANSSSA